MGFLVLIDSKMETNFNPIIDFRIFASFDKAHLTFQVSTYEGFSEDLARQNTVARRFQRQLGFCIVAYGFQSSS
jgi:hypothetical protein